MINGITILIGGIAGLMTYLAIIYYWQAKECEVFCEELQRANRELLLKNSHLLDDLDAAVEAIMRANDKARHPATRSRQYPITSSLASAVTRNLQLINGGA